MRSFGALLAVLPDVVADFKRRTGGEVLAVEVTTTCGFDEVVGDCGRVVHVNVNDTDPLVAAALVGAYEWRLDEAFSDSTLALTFVCGVPVEVFLRNSVLYSDCQTFGPFAAGGESL